jgi:hypothetical protein
MGFDQLHVRGFFKIDCVAFVGVEVNFQLNAFSGADGEVFEDCGTAWRFNSQMDKITVFDTVVFKIFRAHVDVSHGTNHALLEFDNAVGSHEHTAGGALDVTTDANREINAKRNAVGESEFDLRVAAAGAEHSNVGKHSPARTNHCHGFLCRVVAVLVEVFFGCQLRTWAKQDLHMLLSQMDVASGDVDEQRVSFAG